MTQIYKSWMHKVLLSELFVDALWIYEFWISDCNAVNLSLSLFALTLQWFSLLVPCTNVSEFITSPEQVDLNLISYIHTVHAVYIYLNTCTYPAWTDLCMQNKNKQFNNFISFSFFFFFWFSKGQNTLISIIVNVPVLAQRIIFNSLLLVLFSLEMYSVVTVHFIQCMSSRTVD